MDTHAHIFHRASRGFHAVLRAVERGKLSAGFRIGSEEETARLADLAAPCRT